MKHKFDVTATLALLTALLFWSIGPVVIRYLAGHFDFWSQNLYRFSCASLFWLPYVIYSIYKKGFDHRIWKLAIPPAIIWALMQSCWASSLYHINPAFSTLISKSQIIWTSLLVLLFLPEEKYLFKSKRFWSGLFCAITGLLGVVLTSDVFEYSAKTKGVLLVICSAIAWASYTVYLKKVFNETEPRNAVAVITLYATIALLGFAMMFGKPFENLPTSPTPWIAVILSSVTAISLSHVLYLFAVKRVGATIPIVVILMQPFIVLIFSNMVFGETMSVVQLCFGIVLIIGGFVASLAQAKKPVAVVTDEGENRFCSES